MQKRKRKGVLSTSVKLVRQEDGSLKAQTVYRETTEFKVEKKPEPKNLQEKMLSLFKD